MSRGHELQNEESRAPETQKQPSRLCLRTQKNRKKNTRRASVTMEPLRIAVAGLGRMVSNAHDINQLNTDLTKYNQLTPLRAAAMFKTSSTASRAPQWSPSAAQSPMNLNGLVPLRSTRSSTSPSMIRTRRCSLTRVCRLCGSRPAPTSTRARRWEPSRRACTFCARSP